MSRAWQKWMDIIVTWGKKLTIVVLYFFSLFVPRCKDLWVFGSWEGKRYTDNSRHVFEYVQAHYPFIRAVWLTHDPEIVVFVRRQGQEAYLIDSWRAYWLSCRAGLVVVNTGVTDVCYWGMSRAHKINLWHGSPLKTVRMVKPELTFVPVYHPEMKVWRYFYNGIHAERYDLIMATSPVFQERMASAFGVGLSGVEVTGYPRNDLLLRSPPRPVPDLEALQQELDFAKVVLYAPTWRERPADNARLFATLELDRLLGPAQSSIMPSC